MHVTSRNNGADTHVVKYYVRALKVSPGDGILVLILWR